MNSEPSDVDSGKQSISHLHAIFAHTIEGFILLDRDLTILAFNDQADQLIFQHGDSKYLEVGSSLIDYLPPSRGGAFVKMASKVLTGETVIYAQSYPESGDNVRWFRFTISPVKENDQINGLCVAGRDITEDVKLQRQLELAKLDAEQSHIKYKRLFDQSPIPKWIYDLETLRILEVNEEAERHYGYTRAEFLSMTIRDLRPAEDQDQLSEKLASIKQKTSNENTYWRHLKKNGEIIIVDITGHEIDFDGRPARIVACQDITSRINAEASLIESNKRFRYAIRASSDAIWDWDLKESTVFLGEGFKNLFGYDEAGTVVPISWIMSRLHPNDLERVQAYIDQTVKDVKVDRWSDEYQFRKKDGSYALICNTALIIKDAFGAPNQLIGAMRDITEHRQHLNEIKQQNEKLLEIAWLQSHVVRAPLARIMGLVDLAITDNSREDLERILPMLKSSALELDDVVTKIVDETRALGQEPLPKN
ncbi:PAS domain S-box protein [Mucilaginibacter ginkgonis]|uniref:histidine kinase n=1 Tax=Mucilaginibacter ginkgonis TaxID=2682091 RepID=A0A6I4HUV6_9SPHI|nr:PAS domain S-box protein [Mucilaginibacter ginkgonis]QQL50293.1 PAS domain S-box protein [Mucilaginibacter ginkgonis]